MRFSGERNSRRSFVDLDLLRIPYHETIETTLGAVAAYPLPVVRSCHLGNNGTYNWGWLSLARNTRLVLFDHTTYGVDRLCLPWMVLGDNGRVAAFYDIDGHEVDGYKGLHASAAARSISPKYRGILNYGVRAAYAGRPLPAYHFATNLQLARRFNASVPSYDSREILDNFELFSSIVAAAHARRALGRLFDRWAHTRGTRTVFTTIKSVESRGDHVVVLDPGGNALFDGTPSDLLAQLRDSLSSLQRHVEHERPLGPVAYPWLTLPFAYLFAAAIDYAQCSDLRACLHAGGLTSPYYMGQPAFRQRFQRVYDDLADGGFLPRPFRFILLPIGCCQLFATSSPDILENIVGRWRDAIASHPHRRAALDLLARRTQPFGAEFGRATKELDDRFLDWLRGEILRFDESDPNVLPVCYDRANTSSQTFDKYGIGAMTLLQATPRFPTSFPALTWLEGEWLTHVLALVLEDHRELAAADSGFES